MPTPSQLTTAQLRQALHLREQIDSLQAQLDAILGGGTAAAAPAATKPVKTKSSAASMTKGKRSMSPEARARISAGVQARLARLRGEATPAPASTAKAAKTNPQKKDGITPERRAKLSAAMKASWAAKKAAAGNT